MMRNLFTTLFAVGAIAVATAGDASATWRRSGAVYSNSYGGYNGYYSNGYGSGMYSNYSNPFGNYFGAQIYGSYPNNYGYSYGYVPNNYGNYNPYYNSPRAYRWR